MSTRTPSSSIPAQRGGGRAGPAVTVELFGHTDVGRTREHNEDAFIIADLTADRAELVPALREHVVGDRGTLFMVADGMGGAAAGEIASQMATEIVLRELRAGWRAAPGNDGETFARCLRRAASTANAEIHAFSSAHPEFRGMGTTATIAGLLGDTLYLAQVGDSRGYLVRDGVARQITKDQSLIQKLIEAGELTEEEARTSERRNIILQAIGPEATIKVDLTHQPVRRGDVLVLCSDGLSGLVSAEDIAALVEMEPDLARLCERMISLANDRGGPDNITVIVARFGGEELALPESADEVGHRIFPAAESGPVAAVPREGTPTEEIPAVPRDVAAPPPLLALDLEAAGRGMVSRERRRRGLFAAGLLLLALLLVALWMAVRLGRHVLPIKAPATAPASAPATQPATPGR